MTTGIRAGASASDTRLSLVPEAVWGQTPATPGFTNMRFTGEGLRPEKRTTRSNEIRPDRNVTDEIMVGRSASGNVDVELSYGTFDSLLQSVLFAEWVDDKIRNGAGNGLAHTIERTLKLGDGTSHYTRFLGMVANSMSLNIQAGGLVTGAFEMMGRFGSAGTAAIAGATYAEAPQDCVINAATDFAAIAVTGVPAPIIRSLTINLTNNLRAQDAVGNLDAVGLGLGRFEVTGSVNAYFRSGALMDAFLAHEDLGLSFTLGTEAGSRYKFDIPTIVLTGSPGGNATGNDADVEMTLNFTGVLDRLSATPIGATIQIERGV